MAETVLVVEDEDAIADAVAYALEGEGFDVDRAADGGKRWSAPGGRSTS